MEKAYEILKKYYGYEDFRKGQKEILESILNNKDTVGIMPTGGGKSICYQIPALIFEGLTIVISPLISLMKDQVDALKSIGIEAAYINSSLSIDEINFVMRETINGNYKIIYMAPERLNSEFFVNRVKDLDISFIAIDEAHCISQWGHDFRKSYLEVPSFIKSLKKRPVVGAFTATATPQVSEDIKKRLELSDYNMFINGFDRENLEFSVVKGENSRQFILKYLKNRKNECGIIYASTRKEVDSLANELNGRGYKVGAYHAGLNEKIRAKNQENFIYDKIDIIVATNAFGMGIDKSNVRFVIHNNIPRDIESYYQEAGRAGRDGEKSECILIFNPKDIITQRFFIENSEFETNQELKDIKYEKLNHMVKYCHTSYCLRKYLLEYFGEQGVKESCDNCSSCLDLSEKSDITLEAKKIISCVGRLKGAFGAGVVANILGGSKNKKIMDFGLNKQSTYGIMNEYSIKDIKEIINTLIGDEYLYFSSGEYPLLKIGEKGYGFIKSDEKIFRTILKVEEHYEENDEIFDELKKLRFKIAREENIPPYLIFSDKTLKEMSKKIPTDYEAMMKIKGVGELKYKKYGYEFEKVLQNYKGTEKIKEKTLIKTKTKKSSKTLSHKLTYDLYREGKTVEEIAKSREITEQTVLSHLLRSADEGKIIHYEDFFTPVEEEKVLEAIKNFGGEKLTLIKEKVPESIGYDKIKAVISKMQNEG